LKICYNLMKNRSLNHKERKWLEVKGKRRIVERQGRMTGEERPQKKRGTRSRASAHQGAKKNKARNKRQKDKRRKTKAENSKTVHNERTKQNRRGSKIGRTVVSIENKVKAVNKPQGERARYRKNQPSHS